MGKILWENFNWDNKSEVKIEESNLSIKAHPNSDCFINPATGKKVLNSAYYYTEIAAEKDFIIKAKVSHEFKSIYDAGALMIKSSDTCWAKVCFECTYYGTNTVVSVVTNGRSDDANGTDINQNAVYLQLIKKGNVFAMHYSLDAAEYRMVRYFTLPLSDTIKMGFTVQSPLGEGGLFKFEEIYLDYISVEDLKKGI